MIRNTTAEKRIAVELIENSLEPLRSVLQIARGGGIEKVLLELIYLKLITHDHDVSCVYLFLCHFVSI
jgi:hypothetical protein